MTSKSIALANRLHAECDASPAPIKYSTARRGAEEIEKLHALLVKARAGLSNGLWDYGPGQDEHEQCNDLLAEIDAVLNAKPT